MWSNLGGSELTYRQVSRVTDTPDEVNTCPSELLNLLMKNSLFEKLKRLNDLGSLMRLIL